MISRKIDYEKARLLLKHISKTQKKLKEKDIAQKKLGEQIKEIKKFSKKKGFRQQVEELEKRIDEAIEKEQKIIQHQETENSINRRLLDRIQRLELKLGHYMKTKSQRESRLKELEQKIKNKSRARRQDVEAIEKQISLLEKLYRKIRKEGSYTKADLMRVEEKIDTLKSKLEALKNNK